MTSKRWALPLAVFAALLAVAALAVAVWPREEPVAFGGEPAAIYREQGGAKMVVPSGSELEVQSGGTLDIQSGATTDFSSGVDLDGGTLTVDADADTTLAASVDDIVTLTLGAATGRLDVVTGNVRVGNGTPGQTHNGEDLYVEGLAEIDGVAYLDGGADVNGATLTVDADADTTLAASVDDIVTLTLGAAAGRLDVLTGNVRVGNGTPGETHDGEDFYVEGISEYDGAAYFDGAVDMDSTLTLAANVKNVIAPSVATASITYTAGAGGSGTVATILDGEVWIILGVYANVTTNWDVTAGDDAYCNIGDGGDADGLLDLDDAELQAADTEGTGAAAGWQGFMSTDTRGAYMAATPFVYAPSGSDETIDWACGATGDDLEAGALTIYVVYIRAS